MPAGLSLGQFFDQKKDVCAETNEAMLKCIFLTSAEHEKMKVASTERCLKMGVPWLQ
jgi:hypothetical protein